MLLVQKKTDNEHKWNNLLDVIITLYYFLWLVFGSVINAYWTPLWLWFWSYISFMPFSDSGILLFYWNKQDCNQVFHLFVQYNCHRGFVFFVAHNFLPWSICGVIGALTLCSTWLISAHYFTFTWQKHHFLLNWVIKLGKMNRRLHCNTCQHSYSSCFWELHVKSLLHF